MRIKAPLPKWFPLSVERLLSEELRHVRLLIFWAAFGLMFLAAERLLPVANYHLVHCAADDWIPFFEGFLVWYLFWFVELVMIHLYTLLYDPDAFVRLMQFIAITYFSAMICYLIYQTAQSLRPNPLPRETVLSRFTQMLYAFDTPTNVCPSIHVMGALAVQCAVWDSDCFSSRVGDWLFLIPTVLVCAATVFMKQHSMADVLAALPFCGFARWFCYDRKGGVSV